MADSILKNRSKEFARNIVFLCRELKKLGATICSAPLVNLKGAASVAPFLHIIHKNIVKYN